MSAKNQTKALRPDPHSKPASRVSLACSNSANQAVRIQKLLVGVAAASQTPVQQSNKSNRLKASAGNIIKVSLPVETPLTTETKLCSDSDILSVNQPAPVKTHPLVLTDQRTNIKKISSLIQMRNSNHNISQVTAHRKPMFIGTTKNTRAERQIRNECPYMYSGSLTRSSGSITIPINQSKKFSSKPKNENDLPSARSSTEMSKEDLDKLQIMKTSKSNIMKNCQLLAFNRGLKDKNSSILVINNCTRVDTPSDKSFQTPQQPRQSNLRKLLELQSDSNSIFKSTKENKSQQQIIQLQLLAAPSGVWIGKTNESIPSTPSYTIEDLQATKISFKDDDQNLKLQITQTKDETVPGEEQIAQIKTNKIGLKQILCGISPANSQNNSLSQSLNNNVAIIARKNSEPLLLKPIQSIGDHLASVYKATASQIQSTFVKIVNRNSVQKEFSEFANTTGDVEIEEEPVVRSVVKRSNLKNKMVQLQLSTVIKKPHNHKVKVHSQQWIDNLNSICETVRPRTKKAQSFTSETIAAQENQSKQLVGELSKRLDKHRSSQELQRFMLPPQVRSRFTYTLILDLDETLVHFDIDSEQFRVRPFCREFLAEMSNIFELVIFTAAQQDYADFIVDQLDPKKCMIQHRLYRQHCKFYGRLCIKDLSKIGRSLARTILVDNLKDNFMRQPRNGIEILTWTNDPFDCELQKLGSQLKDIFGKKPIANSEIKDVRAELSKIKIIKS